MSAEELNLLEMVQLAVIAADDGDNAPVWMRASHTEELPRVHAFRLVLVQRSPKPTMADTLQEQIAAVPPARRLVWEALGGLRANRPQPPKVRRCGGTTGYSTPSTCLLPVRTLRTPCSGTAVSRTRKSALPRISGLSFWAQSAVVEHLAH